MQQKRFAAAILMSAAATLFVAPAAARADTVPEPFDWADMVGERSVEGMQTVTSETITPVGFDQPATIRMTGPDRGKAAFEYSFDGGAHWKTASVYAGMIQPGTPITLRQTASPHERGGTQTVTVEIDSVVGNFRLRKIDREPDAFFLTNVETAPVGALVRSPSLVTVAGIDGFATAPVWVTGSSGGQYRYSADGGTSWTAWTNGKIIGAVRNGYLVQVRGKAPMQPAATTGEIKLRIGSEKVQSTASFTITTASPTS